MKYQIITGDFVGSNSFTESTRTELKILLQEYEKVSPSKLEYFIRGDGIQLLATENALKEALHLKCLFHAKLNIQIRLSIGVGEVHNLENKLSNSIGEAFVLSGQQLDLMKAEKKLISIKTNSEWTNSEWEIHSKVLDYLEIRRTQNQSEVIIGLLEHKTQTQLATEIGISQPSVNQRIKSSGWEIIEAIVHRYANLESIQR